MHSLWISRFTKYGRSFPASRGDFMKYIRGLSQSDSLVIAKPAACCEPDSTEIQNNFQKDSNRVSPTQKSLAKGLARFPKLLLAAAFLFLLSAAVPALGQSTF